MNGALPDRFSSLNNLQGIAEPGCDRPTRFDDPGLQYVVKTSRFFSCCEAAGVDLPKLMAASCTDLVRFSSSRTSSPRKLMASLIFLANALLRVSDLKNRRIGLAGSRPIFC